MKFEKLVSAKIIDLIKVQQSFAKSERFIENQINFCEHSAKNLQTFQKSKFDHLVDLEKSENMSIDLQRSALIQPRTSPLKFDLTCLPASPSPLIQLRLYLYWRYVNGVDVMKCPRWVTCCWFT